MNDATPTGLRNVLIDKPNVAAARQRWALGRHRFAVNTQSKTLLDSDGSTLAPVAPDVTV